METAHVARGLIRHILTPLNDAARVGIEKVLDNVALRPGIEVSAEEDVPVMDVIPVQVLDGPTDLEVLHVFAHRVPVQVSVADGQRGARVSVL